MSRRDLTDLPGAGDQRDPVEEFFARERADVRDLQAGFEHWEGIVREARRPSRRSWLPYAAVAAVAAVVAAGTWAGLAHRPGDGTTPATASSQGSVQTVSRTVTTAPTTSPWTSSQPSSATTPAPAVSTATGPLPVAQSFGLVSLTNAGGKVLYALGSATCPGGTPCTQVVTSRDDGRTWVALSTFTTLTTAGAGSTPTGAHQLVGIRFSGPDVGYVFGSTTLRTLDGGRSWQPVDVDRRVVLSLETDGDRVWMATARACTPGTPPGAGCSDLQARTGRAGDTATTAVQADGTPTSALAAWIAMDGHDAYLNTSLSDPASPQAARPGPLVRLSGPSGAVAPVAGCDSGMWASGSAAAHGTLVGLCPTKGKPQDEWSVVVSTDRGMTWTTTPAPGLGRPTAPGTWLTGTDAQHLVAVTGGAPSSVDGPPSPTALLASSDGGRTWTDTGPGRGGAPVWAGAAGGSLVYAVEGGLAYWQSTDAGQHFTQVPMRR
ncbi:WD40/YVTN/BNR-like repeat-containing protein [Pedococcus sp. NPDC057267]|uniref:WD40/YVTN/BNR-like repeat-containing protein n=1 Tax=Pedococcus sp. NPDC057267 TaxID=3346077 RepID=UPI00364019F9